VNCTFSFAIKIVTAGLIDRFSARLTLGHFAAASNVRNVLRALRITGLLYRTKIKKGRKMGCRSERASRRLLWDNFFSFQFIQVVCGIDCDMGQGLLSHTATQPAPTGRELRLTESGF